MATIRLIPSIYSLSSTSYLRISNASNMYTNTDSTTYATVNHTRSRTTSYYIYIKGFNFDDIPADAIINSATVKVKAKVTSASSYAPALYNNTTSLGQNLSGNIGITATTSTVDITSNWETYKEYGSNFGIRLRLNRSSSGTASSMNIYGAEILVDYTVPIYHNVSVTQSTGGTISLSQGGQVLEGTTITVTATPSDGYELENIYVNGTALSGTSFVVNEDKAVSAVFNQLIRHTISTSITGGSLRSPTTASATVSGDADYEITFNGNPGYSLSSMTVNGVEVTPIIKSAPATTLPRYTVSTNYSTYQWYDLSNAYDGDDYTYFWSSEAQAQGKYILITFSDFVNLKSFSTYSSNSTDYPHSCNVLQVSADNTSWTNIGIFSDSQTNTFSNITNANNIKYVRIYVNTDGVSNWLVLNEITMSYESASGSGGEYYSYTISAIDSDKTVVIIFNEPDAHYVKVDGRWRKVLTAYRKVNGAWEEFDYTYDDSLQLKYLGHITSDIIGEVTSDYHIVITDTSIPNNTYYFYYEDTNKAKLTDWDVIGSTEFNEYNGGTTTTGEEVGVINEDNSISLTNTSLANGTYTMYYENADGVKLEGWDSIGTVSK